MLNQYPKNLVSNSNNKSNIWILMTRYFIGTCQITYMYIYTYYTHNVLILFLSLVGCWNHISPSSFFISISLYTYFLRFWNKPHLQKLSKKKKEVSSWKGTFLNLFVFCIDFGTCWHKYWILIFFLFLLCYIDWFCLLNNFFTLKLVGTWG